MRVLYVVTDVREGLKAIPTGSVDFVMTSPPFLALRSYLPSGDPSKPLEIGSESTPGEFLDVMLDVTEELHRVIAPHGSLCVELGDTYAGSGGAGGDYTDTGPRSGQEIFKGSALRRQPPNKSIRYNADGSVKTTAERRGSETKNVEQILPPNGGHGWPHDKSLCLIPELYRFALVYGFNPLTGRECTRWRVRNVVRWVRPNPPVGALGDKFRPATSDLVIACKTDEAGRKRYFDLDAVRGPAQVQPERSTNGPQSIDRRHAEGGSAGFEKRIDSNPAGAPPLDWWKIAPVGYEGSHYATYPPELCERPIKAMCPLKVCTVCGEPSRRLVSEPTYVNDDGSIRVELDEIWRHGRVGLKGDHMGKASMTRQTDTLGWTDCGHNSWRKGVVLDPFAGTGTTLAVASGHGRDAIGLDLDHRNLELARGRVGPLLLVEGSLDDLRAMQSAPEAVPA